MTFTEEELKVLQYIVNRIMRGQQRDLHRQMLTLSPAWPGLVKKLLLPQNPDMKVETFTDTDASAAERQKFLAQGYTEREVERLLGILK